MYHDFIGDRFSLTSSFDFFEFGIFEDGEDFLFAFIFFFDRSQVKIMAMDFKKLKEENLTLLELDINVRVDTYRRTDHRRSQMGH